MSSSHPPVADSEKSSELLTGDELGDAVAIEISECRLRVTAPWQGVVD
ncbi:MAG: hypothetical protein OXP68_09565 [Anaerolineaceae bacterium]|nr:hypothetical protein [Anaerolineaceae bacterium]